jgi:hypothetical protein
VPVCQHPSAAFLRVRLGDFSHHRTLLKETLEYFCSLHNWDAPHPNACEEYCSKIQS